MKMQNNRIQSSHRRRASRAPLMIGLIVLAFIGLLLWLAGRDTEVPTTRVELDVTNAALAN